MHHKATHCNTLQHTATHCNTLQHTATTMQHTATCCNMLQNAATQRYTPALALHFQTVITFQHGVVVDAGTIFLFV